MTAELKNLIDSKALPYPLSADESECELMTLNEDYVPEALKSEADALFGGANQGVHVIAGDMYRDGDY